MRLAVSRLKVNSGVYMKLEETRRLVVSRVGCRSAGQRMGRSEQEAYKQAVQLPVGGAETVSVEADYWSLHNHSNEREMSLLRRPL